MGMRQIRAFFLYFPRAEQCGAYFRWSQSETDPVTEIGLKIQAKSSEKPNSKLFFRGRRLLIKIDILAKGLDASKNRLYKANIDVDTEPGSLQNKISIKLSRQANNALAMPNFMICANYKSKYPDFGDEFMTVDMSQDLQVTGTALLNYGVPGASKSCKALPTAVAVQFKHSTTAQARRDLRNTWYYQRCEVDKAKPEWRLRVSNGGSPITESCYITNYDAAMARKYQWIVNFKGITPRLKGIISKAQTVMKAGMLPYWDVDPEALSGPISESPFIQLTVEFKDNEKAVDITVKTSQGTSTFLDTPVRLPGWTQRLRNLKFSKTIPRLIQADILNPCVLTTKSVKTIDNTTLPYSPTSCWSLVSAHCSPSPTYAVFAKANGRNKLDLEVWLGGHKIELTASANGVTVVVDNAAWALADHTEKVLTVGDQEIFKMVKWGSAYNIYSFLKVWIVYDGTFVEVIPAPSVKGQHCGVCGNYDNNRKNELVGKAGQAVTVAELPTAWCK